MCVLFVSGCTDSDNARTVIVGDYISVNYTGSLENGTVFDTSMEDIAKAENIYNPYRNYEPLSFIVGSGQMIPGFDDAVIGMAIGETKTVTMLPEEGYAYYPELVIVFSIADFESANITPVIGEKIVSQNREGTIVNLNEENVTVDFNHRLAGETLTFSIELVSIEDA
ncbi:FKBP-type peptidyl-prolyl cis-trans isomerase [Methanolobus psychrotolerans]|uniref:FKBP-type peptidyl-prolyl cis-trans isomerase n=1 Tax=Methanolobus psychrotolerans TaxID=1874706 RepID=UPI000B91CF52|nr:peptidylprolyl isomerase [Methanolobus psychrotolerans]